MSLEITNKLDTLKYTHTERITSNFVIFSIGMIIKKHSFILFHFSKLSSCPQYDFIF